ncbi:MAG: DNA helicase RecQ [Betaproteobacteria bacterium]|nr:DNA helicase RecQ [Betaproteobacteria bacterium]
MTAQETLKKYFGYDCFRSGQEMLIDSITAGKDVLGVMPTGAGKSICFQIPALMLDGITIIVSPLISLMKDQVNALTQSGVPAAFLNSSLSGWQIDKVLQRAKNKAYKLIYIAPERLLVNDFLQFAQFAEISMLAIDEAHCISQWGQDFRPSYSKIPEFAAKLPKRPIIAAFTATATPKVREDITDLLGLNNPVVLVTGFNRENLYFAVQEPGNKYTALIEFLRGKHNRSGIVYCATRKAVEEVCAKLKSDGYSVSRYHAGLSDDERRDNQDDFIYDRIKIMVATNAFGMGIDKSNVSFVVHYNMPKDIESYYQEAGRAGRDGEPADCVLLYSNRDVQTNSWLIENTQGTEYPDIETEEMLKERSRKRLLKMNLYCSTKDCLRGYILKYFGENPPSSCRNCCNCGMNYETIEITTDAQKILSCVYRMREMYGVKMVIDVLRGSSNEKVLRFGLNKLSTYGISEKSAKYLNEIINQLILKDYLIKTTDQFPILKLGQNAIKVLKERESVQIKFPKDEQRFVAIDNKQLTTRQVNRELLTALRAHRTEIAKAQKLPAYIIFADTALFDMCVKTPTTKEEFLKVSGVGQIKLERYGEGFLKIITDFLSSNKIETTSSIEANALSERLTETTEEFVTVSTIADKINCAFMVNGGDNNRISGQVINDWLVAKGYLTITHHNGKNFKIPTDLGASIGIFSEDRVIRGEKVKVNMFGKAAQELILINSIEIARG